MGCTCSRDEAKKLVDLHSKKHVNPFLIKINIPETDKVKIILFEGKNISMILSDVLNGAFFCTDHSDDIDANFISIYDKANDKFYYHIERLIGYSIEYIDNPEQGKVWNCYINKKKQDWSFICDQNRIVNKGDEIEFRYEAYSAC